MADFSTSQPVPEPEPTAEAFQSFLEVLVPGKEPNLDIVAVHGLNPTNEAFHAKKTWTAGGKLWLRDFLPEDLPNARVLLFGYNSNVAFEGSTSGVHDQAQDLLGRLMFRRRKIPDPDRPIIFIAHSLGGLIVKQALVRGQMGEAYNSIPRNTYGIAFFATPHQSSDIGTKLGEIASNISKEVVHNPSLIVLERMKMDSLYSEQLGYSFQQQLLNYAVISFYETLPSKETRCLIVDKKSSSLGLPDTKELHVPVEADHVSICKFKSADGPDYEKVLANLEPMAREAIKKLADRRQDEMASKAPEVVSFDTTALPDACARGDFEGVHSLVKSGADINVVDARGATPLMIAVEREYTSIVDLLLGVGAKPNFVTNAEKSPLGLAIDKGNIEIAGLLLDNGADLNANSTESHLMRTHPVGHAAQLGDEAMIRLLLEKGADANGLPRNSRYRWTPMHVAMRSSKQEGVIKALLEHGAEIDRKDSLQNTPVDYLLKKSTLLAVLLDWISRNRLAEAARVLSSTHDRRKSKQDPKLNVLHMVLSHSQDGFYGLRIPLNLDHTARGPYSEPLGDYEIPWHEQEERTKQEQERKREELRLQRLGAVEAPAPVPVPHPMRPPPPPIPSGLRKQGSLFGFLKK